MRQNVLLVALSTLGAAVAQAQNFTIDPNAIPATRRTEWCNAQYETCAKLCNRQLKTNECNDNTLEYDCKCSNGTAPGLEYYIQTMPTFICEQAYSDCIAANTASSRAQDQCKSNIKDNCGTLDPAKVQHGGDSEESTSSAAPSATQSNAQNQATSTSTAGAAAATAFYIGNGVAAIAAGVFAAML
ncbi:hypothetical protein VTJ04DRAFT_3661 [Mycothermus thermophilus]|uniref:uncharacterized protein n=1 Tax=Humicola insolens TaxID=85995 RepID=UPI00374373B1